MVQAHSRFGRAPGHHTWRLDSARDRGSEARQLYALVSYRDVDDVQERMEAYLSSREFRADMEGFDISQIVNLAESVLTPATDSPLR